LVVVGYDEENPKKIKDIYFEKVHLSRIMGIWWQNKKQVITISEDFTIKRTDIDNKVPTSST
jgi:hypothetical protein